LLAGLAFGQAAPATPPAAAVKAEQSPAPTPEKAPEAKAPEVKIGPDDAVITLKGFCADAALQGDACKTVITRAQFEKLSDALQVPPATRRRLADDYSRSLKMSAAAEKRGLEKGPYFDLVTAFARVQILKQALNRALQEDADKVSDGDIADYYQKNEGSYKVATFARIYVSHTGPISASPAKAKAGAKAGEKAGEKTTAKASTPEGPTEEQKKAAEERMKKLAETLRARAVKGEDPDKLQKEAHAAAGLSGDAPSTKMEKVRRTMLPANHQTAMDLKPGEVSEVVQNANDGYYIYKLISKETLPMDTVKTEIQKAISKQRMSDSLKSFQSDIELNDAYFGPAQNQGMQRFPIGARPPAQ
jgi:bifunctional DNA-binding transcriptional regulator/antitoxin component of YhaV-PrlF toxin-antitoxin module